MSKLKDLLTVVYYTSNREDEAFEQKIRDNLVKNMGDLPLISVSQKPIDFGKNICVGDVGLNAQNAHRQLQIGATVAKTPFIISAEADCLYPPEYFRFVPKRKDRAYRYNNVYILFHNKNKFIKKMWFEGGQVCAKEFLVYHINLWLREDGWWNEKDKTDKIDSKKVARVLFHKKHNIKPFFGNNPIISIKTKNGMNAKTRGLDYVKPIKKLPYWGSVKNVKEQFL